MGGANLQSAVRMQVGARNHLQLVQHLAHDEEGRPTQQDVGAESLQTSEWHHGNQHYH